jgi:hypothetical protein
MGQEIVAVFQARGTPDMAAEVFAYLMAKLKLYEPLKSAEDVALHNVALEIMSEMRAAQAINLKDMGRITLVIEHERPDDLS